MALRLVIPLVILAALLGTGYLVLLNPPEMERGGPPGGPQTVVETFTVTPSDYQVQIASYGTVQPRTRSALVAQVSGQIVEIAPTFRPGGFFTEDDVLVTIDPRDYEADVKIAEAALMDALQAEAQETARSEQALIDWRRIGDPGEPPSDLVLRRPQLQAAQARVISARSALTKAELKLERTHVQAPFDGRVLAQRADRGQVVSMGTVLAEVYATDYVEVRLPLRNSDLPFVDLPESGAAQPLAVKIRSELGEAHVWDGRIVRAEGAIDETARQLHVVAQISDPFGAARSGDTGGPRQSGAGRPLKIGEYVTAEIDGKRQPGALVIPGQTIYQNSYVYVVEGGELQRRPIEIAWQNGVDALVTTGLTAGDAVVTTPLGQVTSGTRVRVAGTGTGNRTDTRGAR